MWEVPFDEVVCPSSVSTLLKERLIRDLAKTLRSKHCSGFSSYQDKLENEIISLCKLRKLTQGSKKHIGLIVSLEEPACKNVWICFYLFFLSIEGIPKSYRQKQNRSNESLS